MSSVTVEVNGVWKEAIPIPLYSYSGLVCPDCQKFFLTKKGYENHYEKKHIEEESNLVAHARRELEALGNGPEIDDHVIAMVKIFASAGHSGSSAFYTIELLQKLLSFQNLTPLTDDPEDWIFVAEEVWGSPGGIWQNRRNGEAFSNDGGKTYYLLSEGGNDKHREPLHTSVEHKKEQ